MPPGAREARTYALDPGAEAASGSAPGGVARAAAEPAAPVKTPGERAREMPVAARVAPFRAPATSEAIASCPKCRMAVPSGAVECASCGVVFEKYESSRNEDPIEGEVRFRGRMELVELWASVLEYYESEIRHEKFILACDEAGFLPFASHKYARILNVHPQDEIARKMRKKIVALAAAKMEGAKSERPAFAVPWPSMRMPGVSSVIFLLGSFVLTTGLLLPGLSDMVGVGASMLALAAGLRFYLGRQLH